MNKHYFIQIKGRITGPYTLEGLSNLPLFQNTLIWHEGLNNWVNINDVNELKDLCIQDQPIIKKAKNIDELANEMKISIPLLKAFLKKDINFLKDNSNLHDCLSSETYFSIKRLKEKYTHNGVFEAVCKLDKLALDYQNKEEIFHDAIVDALFNHRSQLKKMSNHFFNYLFSDITNNFWYKKIERRINGYIDHVTKNVRTKEDGFFVYKEDKIASEIRPRQLDDVIQPIGHTLKDLLNSDDGHNFGYFIYNDDSFFVSRDIMQDFFNRNISNPSYLTYYIINEVKIKLHENYASIIESINSIHPTNYSVVSYADHFPPEDDYNEVQTNRGNVDPFANEFY
jgi:hypothetical protein